MKLIEIYKKLKTTNKKLFYGNLLQNVECMHDYETNTGVSQIDKVIIRKYGNRVFESLEETEDNILGEWEDIVEGWILANQYNLNKIWSMLQENYDPLYNYDKTSDIKTTHVGDILIKSGTEKEELTKTGSETDTLTKTGTETHIDSKNGTETHTNTKTGSETDTLTKSGSEVKEAINGTTETTTTSKNNAWDSTNEFEVSKSTENTPQHTDTETDTFTNRKDENVKTFTSRKDEDVLSFANRENTDVLTFANRQDANVLTFANRKDTKENSFNDRVDSINYTDTMHEVTKGNIGTTTSSDLLVKEYDARWKVNFYMELFEKIIFDVTW